LVDKNKNSKFLSDYKLSDIPKLVIAGVTSGVGKTTISAAFMYGLKKQGLVVQPFKVGPDFIDPSYHTHITGRESRNLDIWMMGEDGVLNSFHKACDGADVAVIEGLMGLFDGISGQGEQGSTGAIAKLLKAQVVLILDCSKAARSVAAIALGFQEFDKDLRITGVVLNNVASDKHEKLLKEAFEENIKIPIIGLVRRDQSLKDIERHLGRIPTAELDSIAKSRLLNIAKSVSEKIQLDKFVQSWKLSSKATVDERKSRALKSDLRVAIALDESFNFYYVDNLELLRENKIDLIYFSPLHDIELPKELDGIIIGGGFPEIMAKGLEKNRSMMDSIKKSAENGLPILAECGGLMYLTRRLYENEDESSRRCNLVGLIDAETQMGSKLTLNYTEANSNGSILGRIESIKGHEFHYSRIINVPDDSKFAFDMKRGSGITNNRDGLTTYNCLASYTHLHFSDERLLKNLTASFRSYRRR
jgi:cobyrinic acid a,c-diamide synthase